MKHRKLDPRVLEEKADCKLDLALIRILEEKADWLYTDNVKDALRKLDQTIQVDRSLLLRRLNKLNKEGFVRKSGCRDLTRWLTTNPKKLRLRQRKRMDRETKHKRATAAFLALGFATDPESIEVPKEPSEDESVCGTCGGDGIHPGSVTSSMPHGRECSDCDGYGESQAQRDYDRAVEKKDACEYHLNRVCTEYFVTLTVDQFLSLASNHPESGI